MSVNGYGFIMADRHYYQTRVTTPDHKGYLHSDGESLHMRSAGSPSGLGSYVGLQASSTRGLFMSDSYVMFKFDNSNYVRITDQGVQCRCGDQGFGWMSGSFHEILNWSS